MTFSLVRLSWFCATLLVATTVQQANSAAVTIGTTHNYRDGKLHGVVTTIRGLLAKNSPAQTTKVNEACMPGRDKFQFIYTFDDGFFLQGYTSTSDLTLQWCQGPSYKKYPPIKLDISCTSQYSTDGYSTEAGYGPNKGEHPAVSKCTFKTLQGTDCECAQYCSYGSPEDQTTATTQQQTVAVSQPTTTCAAGMDKYHYTHSFEGGCTLEGYSTTSSVMVSLCDKKDTVMILDLSCNYNYTLGKKGYSTEDGFGPTKGFHPAIIDYSIKRTVIATTHDHRRFSLAHAPA
jgi:hypothetical protein